jgi:hypothetical protein
MGPPNKINGENAQKIARHKTNDIDTKKKGRQSGFKQFHLGWDLGNHGDYFIRFSLSPFVEKAGR